MQGLVRISFLYLSLASFVKLSHSCKAERLKGYLCSSPSTEWLTGDGGSLPVPSPACLLLCFSLWGTVLSRDETPSLQAFETSPVAHRFLLLDVFFPVCFAAFPSWGFTDWTQIPRLCPRFHNFKRYDGQSYPSALVSRAAMLLLGSAPCHYFKCKGWERGGHRYGGQKGALADILVPRIAHVQIHGQRMLLRSEGLGSSHLAAVSFPTGNSTKLILKISPR